MNLRLAFFAIACCTVYAFGCKNSDSRIASDSNPSSVKLTGSGASFPFPLYDRWFQAFCSQHASVKIDYQAKGSGAGIKDLIQETVDFAASDAGMTEDEIQQVSRGVQLLPLTAGKIVLAFNLPGIQELNLSRQAYADIFLGKIKNWNSPAIAASNPQLSLPDLEITVVRRADSSGTTFVFTQHLTAISQDWASGPGTGKTVVWPSSDKFIAAPKNDGITATIRQTPGAIGYIEYGYAKLTQLTMASLENRAGKFVRPSLESGQAALANIEMPADLQAWLPDPVGETAYPIVTYTWLLAYKQYDDPRKSQTLKEMVGYCLSEGQKFADEMGYIPLPPEVAKDVLAALENIQ